MIQEFQVTNGIIFPENKWRFTEPGYNFPVK